MRQEPARGGSIYMAIFSILYSSGMCGSASNKWRGGTFLVSAPLFPCDRKGKERNSMGKQRSIVLVFFFSKPQTFPWPCSNAIWLQKMILNSNADVGGKRWIFSDSIMRQVATFRRQSHERSPSPPSPFSNSKHVVFLLTWSWRNRYTLNTLVGEWIRNLFGVWDSHSLVLVL